MYIRKIILSNIVAIIVQLLNAALGISPFHFTGVNAFHNDFAILCEMNCESSKN